ncbi:MAG TPA: protein kinase [Vicinamibacterales bacterium]
MTLPAGTRIGPYEILAPIGAGGMGEVYRARDNRLDRDVAIKILPPAFAADAERLARFEREAKTLAALNHTNIAQIYGLEATNGATALVMELVEGEDLSARIARGAVPLAEALEIARQIAVALEAAHERGIIHRDLKPANIKVRADGTVKVLDFGLAKALDASAGSNPDIMNSPTITSPATPGTMMGMIIGTAAYMAPEQAKGRAIDRRADVWAFGVVLFEMLTGQRVFEGGDITEVLASVIKDTPSHDALPAETPPAIRRLLRRCLEKNPAKRLDSMGAARLEIEEAIAGDHQTHAAPGPPLSRARRLAPWAVAAAAVIIAATAGIATWTKAPEDVPVTRVKFDPGVSVRLYTLFGSAIALSPDGRMMVFAGEAEGSTPARLYLRHFDRLDAMPLPGTEDGVDPFFSPDGQWIGFFAGGKLRKIAVSGGAAVDIADTRIPRGGAWAGDGTIYFTPTAMAGTALMRVPDAGGAPQPVGPMIDGHVTQRWPQLLPGEQALIYTGHTTVDTFEDASLVVQKLDGSAPRVLMTGGYHWRYLPSGHVVYVHAGTLFAVPFDAGRLEITGTAVPVVEKLLSSPVSGGAQFAFSSAGTVAYMIGESQLLGSTLSWIDLTGRKTPVREMKEAWTSLALSPDGTRLAIDRLSGSGQQPELWVLDLARGNETRLTVNQVAEMSPVWTPDGTRVVYGAASGGPPNLFWQPVDGSAPAERLATGAGVQIPWSWHPDGKRLVFSEGGSKFDLFVMTFPEKTITPFVQSTASEAHAAISPDGKWIAYASDESNQVEIYVRPFPTGTGRWMVSNETGLWPIWSRTGNVLYYATMGSRLMAVKYQARGSVFEAGRPEAVPGVQMVSRGALYSWALHPDGRRFLGTVPDAAGDKPVQQEVVLITGFTSDLRTRVK